MALAGAGVSCLLMMVFLGYLYVNHAEKAFEGRVTHLKIEADDLARSGESRTAVEKYDNLLAMIEQKRFGAGRYRRIVASATTSRNRLLAVVEAQKKPRLLGDKEASAKTQADGEKGETTKPEEPIHLTDDEIPAAAEFFIQFTIIDVLRESVKAEEVTIQSIKINPSPVDERRIPWLWYAMADVEISFPPEKPGLAAKHMPIVWKSLFQYTPESKARECWREVTFTRAGSKARNHYDLSEWTPEFRSTVSEGWLRKFQEYDRDIAGDESLEQAKKLEALRDYKKDVARGLTITVEELDEILASAGTPPRMRTDSTPPVAAPQPSPRSSVVPEAAPKEPSLREQVLADYLEKWCKPDESPGASARIGCSTICGPGSKRSSPNSRRNIR